MLKKKYCKIHLLNKDLITTKKFKGIFNQGCKKQLKKLRDFKAKKVEEVEEEEEAEEEAEDFRVEEINLEVFSIKNSEMFYIKHYDI